MTGTDVRVAVVDDELFFREAICEILGAAGFEVADRDATLERVLRGGQTTGRAGAVHIY